MSPLPWLKRLKRLFRRPAPDADPGGFVVAPLLAPVDDRPEWRKRIDRINEICEERKRANQLLQGGRIVDDHSVDVDENRKKGA
jgi:hypothetical protein